MLSIIVANTWPVCISIGSLLSWHASNWWIRRHCLWRSHRHLGSGCDWILGNAFRVQQDTWVTGYSIHCSTQKAFDLSTLVSSRHSIIILLECILYVGCFRSILCCYELHCPRYHVRILLSPSLEDATQIFSSYLDHRVADTTDVHRYRSLHFVLVLQPHRQILSERSIQPHRRRTDVRILSVSLRRLCCPKIPLCEAQG